MKRLIGKVALVTGAANGIGLEISRKFIEEGALVWAVDKDLESLKKCAWATKRIMLDISNPRKVDLALGGFGFDILVNNAAITCGDDHDRIVKTNINGTRAVTETVLKKMVSRKRGKIIFITSVHSALAFPGDAAYDASKSWAVSYMRARAIELAS